jgi:hypothetical protein
MTDVIARIAQPQVVTITTVNVARLEEREHWITDVLSGDLLGALGAVVGSLAAQWFVRRRTEGGHAQIIR